MNKVNTRAKNFDLHVVADEMPRELETTLLGLGYKPKVVIGGDPRVRMQHLFSFKVEGREVADDLFRHSVAAIERHPSFVGYIEEEVVAHDVSIVSSPSVGDMDPFPEIFRVDNCPIGIYKKCDIHVAIPDSLESVTHKLRDAGFYYLNLFKPEIGFVNVTTIQTEDVLTGKRIWDLLMHYLPRVGGFNGFAKFEVTAAIKNFGFRLPPIVLKSSDSSLKQSSY
jgi:hypothetical protein